MSNLNREEATALAQNRIEHLGRSVGDRFELMSDLTKEVDQGWVFFFNTAEYVSTRNPLTALAGNGPILVTRRAEVFQLSSAIPWEIAVKNL